MKILSSVKLSHKLLASPLIILVFMIGMGLLTFKTLVDQRDITFVKIESGQEDLTTASRASLKLNELHSDLYRLMNLMAIGANDQKIQESLADIRSRISEIGKELSTSLANESNLDEFFKVYDEKTVYALDMSEIEFTASLMLLEDAAAAFVDLNKELTLILERDRKNIQESIANGKDRVAYGITFYSVLFLISVIISVPAALFIANLLRKQIAEVGIGISSAGKGDLTTRIKVTSSDEIGQMANEFNDFLETQQALIGHISESVDQVAQSADRLTGITVENDKLIEEQHVATDYVASAINEMTASVKEVAQNAKDAAEAAQGADNHANEGNMLVQDTVSAIHSLSRDVENSTNVTHQLEEDSESIGSVLDVIKGVAEQTNLLALNAAIEAARAGEQGRGFAVVADEVRTLASRTQESTNEIENMIESFKGRSKEMVSTMQTSQEMAKDTVKQAGSAGDSLSSITEMVASISAMNTEIDIAAKEQTKVTDEINQTINRISDIASRSSESAKQTSLASDQLASLASDLTTKVSRFKIA